MKATIESTDRIVDISGSPFGSADGKLQARVWEGITDKGVAFVAYVHLVQVRSDRDCAEFERDLIEHKQPSGATLRAIDARFII